jgi:hypothetical protein
MLLLSAVALLWVTQIVSGASGILMSDFGGYWQAGDRLRAGAPLYFTPANGLDPAIYRYAPWFAWLWVPLTYLPRGLVELGWLISLSAAAGYALWPLRASPAMLLLAPSAIAAVYYGNVQMLLVAGLVYGLPRQSGPLWIALAASLKAVPILLVLVYLGRREWAKAAWTLGLTGLLVGPMLVYDLTAYPIGRQAVGLAAMAPPVWVALTVLGAAATIAASRSRYGWLAASATLLLATPRFALYELNLLAVGVPRNK